MKHQNGVFGCRRTSFCSLDEDGSSSTAIAIASYHGVTLFSDFVLLTGIWLSLLVLLYHREYTSVSSILHTSSTSFTKLLHDIRLGCLSLYLKRAAIHRLQSNSTPAFPQPCFLPSPPLGLVCRFDRGATVTLHMHASTGAIGQRCNSAGLYDID